MWSADNVLHKIQYNIIESCSTKIQYVVALQFLLLTNTRITTCLLLILFEMMKVLFY